MLGSNVCDENKTHLSTFSCAVNEICTVNLGTNTSGHDKTFCICGWEFCLMTVMKIQIITAAQRNEWSEELPGLNVQLKTEIRSVNQQLVIKGQWNDAYIALGHDASSRKGWVTKTYIKMHLFANKLCLLGTVLWNVPELML